MPNLLLPALGAALLAASGCKKETIPEEMPEPAGERATLGAVLGEELVKSEGGVALHPLAKSVEFPDAALRMTKPAEAKYEGPTVPFEFELENFELKEPTAGPAAEQLAVSDKGQHIHVIVDDQPYDARYEVEFEKEIEPGHHRVVTFLSRSYHESIKHPAASAVHRFVVGEPKGESPFVEGGPSLVYSRPKGTYEGEDAEAVLLDFYLLEGKLSPDGHQVEVQVADLKTTISEWRPYVLVGLPEGELDVRLRLLDAEGNLVPGPFNDTTRKITIKRAAPRT